MNLPYIKYGTQAVTPFAGVWIEISSNRSIRKAVAVTPFAGVWIEIALARSEPHL